MRNFKIGLQLYSVRDAMEVDMDATLKAVKEMGYDYVEYAGGKHGKSWQEIRQLLDKYDLKCVSVHQTLNNFLDDPEGALEQVRVLGASYCAICHYALENYTERWEESIEKIKRWGKGMAENGIRPMYHNHAFEFETINGEYILDKIFAEVPQEHLKPEYDVAWLHYGGVNPAEYMVQYNGKLDVVHLKDFACHNLPNKPIYELFGKNSNEPIPTRPESGFEYLPVGSGIQDWQAILASCEKIGAEYLIVEQDQSLGRTSLEAAQMSVRYLKNMLQ